jgi:hypothetical protein
MQIPVLTTRFDSNTWLENSCYKERNGIQGCIYGSATKIKEKIPLNEIVFVVEMNNSTNKIEGISLVRNIVHFDKYYKIYSSGTYNRFIYKSNYRIDRANLEQEFIDLIDKICFKGKTHLKRGIGFTSIPEKMIKTSTYDLEPMIKAQFLKKFGNHIIEPILESEEPVQEKNMQKSRRKRKFTIIEQT